MRLSRERIVDAACVLLGDHGLGGLSMRGLAQRLDVRPGALYYHIPSKQDLLAAVAERLFADAADTISRTDARQAAQDIRAALLRMRDSAEIVSFVYAFRPDALAPLDALPELFDRFPPRTARWAARALVLYVLGHVTAEQNRAELVRNGIPVAATDFDDPRAAFLFGVDAFLRGLDGPG